MNKNLPCNGYYAYIITLVWYAMANSAALADSTGSYQLGRGYTVGETGLHLGGYASTKLQGFGDLPWAFDISDVSLFVGWDNGAKLRFFSEIEVEDVVVAGEYQSLSTKEADFQLERLYLDYLVSNHLTVRIGKILTPIGQWNVIHADPLVWTTTRPVATYNLFPEHATGVMLHGSIPMGTHSLDYAVYGDDSAVLDPRPTEAYHFDNAVGMRLSYNLSDSLHLGVSYVDFALRASPELRNHLTGFDMAWSYQRFAINSEVVYRNSDDSKQRNAWQGYIQGVSPLMGHVYAIGRYEFFDQPNLPTGHAGVLGLAYRPMPPLTWKLEYRLGQYNEQLAPSGLFTSFSVLF